MRRSGIWIRDPVVATRNAEPYLNLVGPTRVMAHVRYRELDLQVVSIAPVTLCQSVSRLTGLLERLFCAPDERSLVSLDTLKKPVANIDEELRG